MKLGTGLPTAKFVVDFVDANLRKAVQVLNENKDEIVAQVNQLEGDVEQAPEL
tara:strand:+ start:146 stop:304 length:159 start_codon:yes stop_codon:yes gene_type:complete